MKIIIKTKQPKQQGLFACVFAQLLEILPFLKKNNIYPEFIITSVFYGLGRTRNVFPHYVQHNYDYETNNNMEPNMELVNSLKNESSTENCIEIYFEEVYKKKSNHIPAHEAHKLFFEYFKFDPAIYETCKEMMIPYEDKKILGLHYRGTDKMQKTPDYKGYYEATHITLDSVLEILKHEIEVRKIDAVFVATDDPTIIPNVEKYLQKDVIYFTYNFPIPVNAAFHSCQRSEKDKLEMGLSAIRDVIVLSQCNVVFKYCSQMSAFCKIFNPDLEIYRVNKPNYFWLPESLVPLYDQNTRS
jgi:hypothetical protein